jgi:hypothetical protein
MASQGGPADLAADFHSTFSAVGWTQGGRRAAPLVAWQPEADKWVRRWKKSNASGAAGAAADFNPDQEHAHTGGIPAAN